MSEVAVSINNRGYSLSCDDGQEQRLQELAQYVDSRLHDIAQAGAASGESHLLVLTSLVLADEIMDLKDRLLDAERQAYELISQMQQQEANRAAHRSNSDSEQEDLFVAQAIEHIAGKIENIAEHIQKA